jgi:hypothetical protein
MVAVCVLLLTPLAFYPLPMYYSNLVWAIHCSWFPVEMPANPEPLYPCKLDQELLI